MPEGSFETLRGYCSTGKRGPSVGCAPPSFARLGKWGHRPPR